MQEQLTGRAVSQITRELFPIGKTTEVWAFIDRCSGWEFDAPLHVMEPFHRYHETTEDSVLAVFCKLEDLLIDLECGRAIQADSNAWPYGPAYLKRIWPRIKSGKRSDRFSCYRALVTVVGWAEDGWNLKVERLHK